MVMLKKDKKVSLWARLAFPVVFIAVWLVVSGVGGPYFGKIDQVSSTDLTTFLPKNAESTKVNNELSKFSDSTTIPLLVVFDKHNQTLTTSDMSALKAATTSLQNVHGVKDVVSVPIQSTDMRAAFSVVPLDKGGDFKQILADIKAKLAAAQLATNYKLTGPASFAEDLQNAFSGIDGTLLFVALAVVFAILLVVYRSPFLPIIVLVAAMCALSAAILVVWHLAKAGVVQLNGQVQGILFILVIGAATDYSLLYIARYREELARFETPWQASLAALKSSFEPIVAAAGTVAAGLLCLLASDLGSNKALGPVGGIGVGFALLAALTFLPALLLLLGRGAFWPRRPKYEPALRDSYEHRHPAWKRIGALVQRYPRRIWIISVVLLLIACTGIFQLKADGVPQNDLVLGYSEARDGQNVLDAHFPSGSGSPVLVLVSQAHQDAVVKVLDADRGVDTVSIAATGVNSGSAPVGKYEQTIKQQILNQATAAHMARFAENLYPFKNAKTTIADGTVLLEATLKDPADSFTARDTVVRLRGNVKAVDNGAMLGGATAIQYDTNQAAIRDRTVIIPLILVVITIILMLLLRSVVAPLVLLLTTVLSFGTTMGISAYLFNYVWQFPGSDPAVIIFGFVFLVALGIDYNIFLMTRVREETLRLGVRAGTVKGLVVTGGVITSAGVVLASTFAALGVIPIMFLAQIAFIVAFGVLLDTIVVRSLLVPALTLQIGSRMWWPNRHIKK